MAANRAEPAEPVDQREVDADGRANPAEPAAGPAEPVDQREVDADGRAEPAAGPAVLADGPAVLEER